MGFSGLNGWLSKKHCFLLKNGLGKMNAGICSALVKVLFFKSMEDLFHWIGANGRTFAINEFEPPSPKRMMFFDSRSLVVTMESFLTGSSALKNNSQSFLNRSSS